MVKNSKGASINWFPGHMAKASRELEESLKLVDMIIEIRDARMPFASFNESFKKIYSNKKRLIIFNKADQLNSIDIKKIEDYFKDENILLIDARDKSIKSVVVKKINEICKDKVERNLRRGIKNTEIRSMVIGIPNVGKSTFINTISSRKSLKVENKPGVTRNLQWVMVDKTIKLLDTPGILPPKLNSEDDAILLSLLGSIKDDILDPIKTATYALEYINNIDFNILKDRYNIETFDNPLEEIAKSKNILQNNDYDLDKTAIFVINDVRNGKLGKILWEDLNARK